MRIVAIIALIVVLIYAIIEMKASGELSKRNEYNKLTSNEKREVIKYVKNFWKILIILIAFIFSVALIVVSTYMGKGTSYENIISIGSIVIAVMMLVVILLMKSKFNKNVMIYFK